MDRWLHNPTGCLLFSRSVSDALRELQIVSVPGQSNQRGGWLMTATGQRLKSPGIIPLSILAEYKLKDPGLAPGRQKVRAVSTGAMWNTRT